MRYTDDDIRRALESAIDRAGGVRAYARLIGISATMISQVRLGYVPPGPTVARALGYIDDGKKWIKA